MAGIPSDYTIIGLVLAISIAIILLAGLALYVSFRVRDTMREEKGRGARAAKVGLLIGLLFLAGGVFFFFASGINANNGSASTTTSISSSSLSTSTSATTPTTTSSTTATSTSTSSGQAVSMNIQCPTSGGSVTAGGSFTCTVTIYNLGTSAYQGATLVSSGDLSQFAFQSCSMTINGIQASCTVPSTTEISIGSISPGTTLLTLGLVAPSTNGQKSCTITLAASGMAQPLATTFTIQVIK
jgi:hypothetical protein